MPRFSIRVTLLLIIGALNLVITVLVGHGVYRSWVNYEEVQFLQRGSSLTNTLYNINQNLSLERGMSVSIMFVSADVSSELQQDLLINRDRVDRGLEYVFSQLEQDKAINIGEEIARVQQQYLLLKKVREALDHAMKQTQEKRDVQIANQFFNQSTTLILQIQKLILSYAHYFQGINATITQQMIFKSFVWELMEYAGEEYALIARLIAENVHPTPSQHTQLTSVRNRAEYGWQIIHQFTLHDQLAEDILPVMNEAETHYFLTFDQIKDLFHPTEQNQGKANYPLSIDMWLGMAAQAVDSLVVLQEKVLEESQRYVNQVEHTTRERIVISVLIFVGSIAISLYCWAVIALRVTRPVNIMINKLYGATHDNSHNTKAMPRHQDEIEKLAHVLEAFQGNARKIKQSNEELERYAYITAHDLKSPLRGIDNLSQWIEEDLGEALTAKSKEYMETLRNRVRRMEKLLNDTLEYSRIDNQKNTDSNEALTVYQLLEDIIALLSPMSGFIVNIDPELANVHVTRIPLQQIFQNLVHNAIKHHDKNTGTIKIWREGIRNNQHIFCVRDDGPGIPFEFRERVFEMFQTLQSRDQKEGSGMGLAFIKKIVTNSGGNIEIESTLGKGCLFRFTWPKL